MEESMEKKDVEKELGSLLERTLSWENDLNSLFRMDDWKNQFNGSFI